MSNVTEALETAIAIYEASESKLKRVIRRKRRLSKDIKKEQREQARVARKLAHLENLLAEYEAGRVVISAPTKKETREVAKWLKTLRDLTIQDAMVAAGFKLITNALRDAESVSSHEHDPPLRGVFSRA